MRDAFSEAGNLAGKGSEMRVRLQDGDTVCIVGGGPAGSASALHLLRLAGAQGLHLEILIFEPRKPQYLGSGSCKGCAGILSNGALRQMDALGLDVPPEVVQAELRAYVVHVAGQATSIVQPDPRRRILSVYRGSGPRRHPGAPLAGFDAHLLRAAAARGARHIPERVRRVEWEDGPVAYTESGRFPASFLVLATGVNSLPPLSPAFGYEPPESIPMAQDEIPRPPNWPEDKVAGFFDQPPGLIFGAVVPKGAYLNVSLLWEGAPDDAIQRFYSAQPEGVGRFFPEMPQSCCNCHPRILVTPARTYFGDRWVATGDAAVARLYKDGINSAFITSGRAMQAAVEQGVDRESLQLAYAPVCREIADDNRYGKLLYAMSSRALRNTTLAGACISCVRAETDLPADRRLYSRLMWGMLTGDESYRELFRLILQPRGLFDFSRQLLLSDHPLPPQRTPS